MNAEAPKHVDVASLVPEFDRKFPMEMGILRTGGVYPGERAKEFVNPYTKEIDDTYYGNIGEHCVAVAHCAEVLAENVLGPGNPRTKKIVSRALIHDSTKRYELARKKAGVDVFKQSAYDAMRPLLEVQGVSPDIIYYMADAGTETGHHSLDRFIEEKNGIPVLKTDNNLPELIVHLADDMTYTPIANEGQVAETSYLTFQERSIAANFFIRYPFLYREGFGFDQNGQPVLVNDLNGSNPGLHNINTYHHWQLWEAKEISRFLTGKISPETPPENAEQYLKELINKSLED